MIPLPWAKSRGNAVHRCTGSTCSQLRWLHLKTEQNKTEHLEKNNTIEQNQCRFMKGISCLIEQLKFFDNVITRRDHQESVAVMYLDF